MDGPGEKIEAPFAGNPKVSALLAIYWSQLAIPLAFVSLRIYSRYIRHAFGWDDASILMALVCCVKVIIFIGTM